MDMRKKVRIAAFAVCGSLLVASCGQAASDGGESIGGSQEDSGSADSSADEGQISDADGEAIVFGGALPLTGWGSDAGSLNLRGYELWEQQVNEAGGILGRPVKIQVYDDQSDPTTTARLYERLITEDEVDILLAPWSDDMTMPATTVAEKHGKPMVTGGATLTEIWSRDYKYVTGLLPSSYDYVGVAIRMLEGEISSAGVLHNDALYTTGFGDAAVENISELGIDLIGPESYAGDTQNFTPVISKIGQASPDMLVAGTGGADDGIQIVQAAKVAGLAPDAFYLTIAPVEPEFVETLGPDAEYLLGTTEWEPSLVDLPDYDLFVDGYQEMFGEEPVEDAATAYGVAQTLQMAVEEAGELDDDAINDALHTMEVTTVFGEYAVDEATGMQTGKRMYVIQIQDGQREIVWPEEFATSELIYPMPSWSER